MIVLLTCKKLGHWAWGFILTHATPGKPVLTYLIYLVNNSGAILDSYADKDDRFVVIHKKNAGVSAARNDGIKKADGEYIFFMDADDWIDVDYLQHMVATAVDANADMVVSGFVSDNKFN